MALGGRIKRWARGLFKPLPALETEPERPFRRVDGVQSIGSVGERETARVAGVIRSIAIGPRGPGAMFEAELTDGTGDLKVIWLGQRQILGLEPGRQLICHGLVAREGAVRVMRDPYYELAPVGVVE
ncbi:MAG: OB-fold nucleic acid binding domain-containing protein [Bifidobacteriaceae bacterium]|jgi:hypothetical protein|nr:OB-fold nucleic acid binding domain-containing protein [Bifidobacteriaceae bacterium]